MATTVATPTDFWRLAEEAERRGIRILVEPLSGEHFATSAKDATRLYRVTGFSCTCKGFLAWQRCTHHSLLLAQLGWLPDPEPDPEPPTPAAPVAPIPTLLPCPACRGRGTEQVQGLSGAWYEVPCLHCDGAGEVEEIDPGEGDGDTSAHDAPYDGGRALVVPLEPEAGTGGAAFRSPAARSTTPAHDLTAA